jgi:hypothetical protein
VALPGPLVDVGANVDDAFAEVLRGEIKTLRDGAGGGIYSEDGGVAGHASAFIEESVEVEEAFGVAGGGVRKGGDDLVSIDRRCSETWGGEREYEEAFRNASEHEVMVGLVGFVINFRGDKDAFKDDGCSYGAGRLYARCEGTDA